MAEKFDDINNRFFLWGGAGGLGGSRTNEFDSLVAIRQVAQTAEPVFWYTMKRCEG